MGAGGGQGTKKYDEGMQENRLKIDEMYSLIPKDQYFCPKCNKIPQLINVHTDNGYLELKCITHGDIFIKVDEYLERMKNSKTYYKEQCSSCNKVQSNTKDKQLFKYCIECQKNFCDEDAGEHQKILLLIK